MTLHDWNCSCRLPIQVVKATWRVEPNCARKILEIKRQSKALFLLFTINPNIGHKKKKKLKLAFKSRSQIWARFMDILHVNKPAKCCQVTSYVFKG